jgi:hypothetical protein
VCVDGSSSTIADDREVVLAVSAEPGAAAARAPAPAPTSSVRRPVAGSDRGRTSRRYRAANITPPQKKDGEHRVDDEHRAGHPIQRPGEEERENEEEGAERDGCLQAEQVADANVAPGPTGRFRTARMPPTELGSRNGRVAMNCLSRSAGSSNSNRSRKAVRYASIRSAA